MQTPIVLIGPMCSGKSTVAALLAKRMGIPHRELDELRDAYYNENGYDKEMAAKIAEEKGMLGIIQYWKPFEAYAVEQVVLEHQNCVISFGAGHSVHEDKSLFARVEKALLPIDNVFLLLPSVDLDFSVEVLNQRFSQLLEREVGFVDPELLRLNEHFVRYPSNTQLAKKVFYTDGQIPEETCEEIMQWLQDKDSESS
jgi:shikimate kinase